MIIFLKPNLQLTELPGLPGGVSVVVNITVSPTVAFRGPSGNTPAPLVKPGEDSYESEKNLNEDTIDGPWS